MDSGCAVAVVVVIVVATVVVVTIVAVVVVVVVIEHRHVWRTLVDDSIGVLADGIW